MTRAEFETQLRTHLSAYLESRSESVRAFCQRTGIPYGNLPSWLKGKSNRIGPDILLKVAAAIGRPAQVGEVWEFVPTIWKKDIEVMDWGRGAIIDIEDGLILAKGYTVILNEDPETGENE